MLLIRWCLNETYPSCVLAVILIVLVPWLMCMLSFRCMQNTADGPSEHVEDYLCDPEDMPLGSRECKLPCPEDCVISEWGPWTQCALVRLLTIWVKWSLLNFWRFKKKNFIEKNSLCEPCLKSKVCFLGHFLVWVSHVNSATFLQQRDLLQALCSFSTTLLNQHKMSSAGLVEHTES